MRRRYVDALVLHSETQLVIGGLWVITGFRRSASAVDKNGQGSHYILRSRAGRSSSIRSRTFSETPLVAIFYLGISSRALPRLVAILLMLRWAFGGIGVAGWVSVMLSVWLLGGLAILFIGVIGMYLSKIFIETKHRPYTIVREMHRSAPGETSS